MTKYRITEPFNIPLSNGIDLKYIGIHEVDYNVNGKRFVYITYSE